MGEAGLPPDPFIVRSELRLLPKLTGQVPVSGVFEAAAPGYAHGGADAEATQGWDVNEQVRN